MSGSAESLGSPGLSVRSPSEDVSRPKSQQSCFSEKLDFDKLALTGEPTYRAVAEGDVREIGTVNDGINTLDDYIEEKKDATLVLEHKTDGDVMALPYNHRWTREYRDMLYAKLKDAERALDGFFGGGPVPVTLLTLTAHQTDESGRPRPLGGVLNDLLGGWGDFRKALARATEGHRTEYMRIVEPHESGYPHIHVAVFGVAMPTLQSKVQDLWVEKYGVGNEAAHRDSVEVARGRTAQMSDVAAYMMKYLGKTTVRQSGEKQHEGYQAFSALLWATGARQYSVSEGLSHAMARPIDVDEVGQWEFIGAKKEIEPGYYTGDVAEQLLDHLSDGPWRPPPRQAVESGPTQTGLI